MATKQKNASIPHIGSRFEMEDNMGTTLEQFLNQSDTEYLKDVFDLVGKKSSTPQEVQDFVSKKVRELQSANNGVVDLSKLFPMLSNQQAPGIANPLSTLFYGSFLVKEKVIKFLTAQGVNESLFFEMDGKYFMASSSHHVLSSMFQNVRNKDIHRYFIFGGRTPATFPAFFTPGAPVNPSWHRGGVTYGQEQTFQPQWFTAEPTPWFIQQIGEDAPLVI